MATAQCYICHTTTGLVAHTSHPAARVVSAIERDWCAACWHSLAQTGGTIEDAYRRTPGWTVTTLTPEGAAPMPAATPVTGPCYWCNEDTTLPILATDSTDNEERRYCRACWDRPNGTTTHGQRYREQPNWVVTDLAPVVAPVTEKGPDMTAQLEQALGLTATPQAAPVAPVGNPVVAARVISIDPAGNPIFEFTAPGKAASQMGRVKPNPNFTVAVGDTYNLELGVDQRVTPLRYDVELALPLTPVAVATPAQTAYQAPPPVARIVAPAIPPDELPLGLRYIDMPPNFHVTQTTEKLVDAWEQMSQAGKYVKARLIGPSGVGKTEICYHYAAKYGRPFLKINAGALQSPESWFGMRTFRGGEDHFQETAFVRALRTPRALILIDEINRTHASNHAALFAILDDTREAWIDEVQQLVTVDPSVVIVATMNVGSEYSGTFDLDAALEGRFQYPLELDWLPPVEEAKVLVLKTGLDPKTAMALVELAGDIRRAADPDSAQPLDKAVSTRTLLAVADLIAKGGLAPDLALKGTILPLYSKEGGNASQRYQVGQLAQGKFAS